MSQLAPRLTFTFSVELECPVEAIYEDLSEPPGTGPAASER